MKRITIRKRTVVTMVYAAADRAVFGVFRARVRYTPGAWTWDVHHATMIATEHVPAGAPRPDYRAMAQRHATPDYPALAYPESN